MTVNTTAPIETVQLSPRQPQAPPNTPTGPVAAAPAGLASAVTAAAPGAGSATSSAASTPTIPAAPANTPVSPSRRALPSPLGKTPPTKFSETDSDDNDDKDSDDGKLPHEAADLLPHASLVKYANFKGFVSLVVTPFFQGMFYGFGEGTAKVLIGRWFGIDPLTALGGNPAALQSDRRRRRKPFDFFGLFGRKRDAGSVVAAAAGEPEMGGPVGWISSKLRSNAIEGSNGGDAGLKYFSMGMDDSAPPPPVSGFSRQDERRSAFT
ncbi:hypothetical protein HDU87_003577 [Geranomyces variabilis]|uniref:Uncharacterized protein n=1 Tax=Geranomyces variabilis TaxID=109894 RepID=A0AAD5XR95_9FUNG|nr:hypothetical protein HDU87_003577 [Geranomyces variabilis]